MPDLEISIIDADTRLRLRERLTVLFGDRADVDVDRVLDRLAELLTAGAAGLGRRSPRGWNESDVVLITYGDQVQRAETAPLAALQEFLRDEAWSDLISTVHLLPFFPYSSDDGFSVIDYAEVDPAQGDWNDVERLGERFRLMFDLVLNHCSVKSKWFAAYLRKEPPYDKFFIEVDLAADLSEVVRPRSLPLLTEVETADGPRHVWTTFSADQVDLNYAEPEVLLTMLDVLLEYAARGAQVVRLDAVAFLWKEIGTSCLHLSQTHEAVKLMRDVLEIAAPDVWLITETNVPHAENISYFGAGDEAHMVYQFALPPLLLDAFAHGDASYFMHWLAQLAPPPTGCTYFNFTASHDGVGVRPLEGLVPAERLESLVAAMQARGGLVSTRRRDDHDVPYELNISYVDALAPEDRADVELHARRFLASQAVMLALQGVPAPYFHSVVGSRNDRAAVESSGQPRRINRHKFQRSELDAQLGAADSLAAKIYEGYRNLLQIRREQPAFHPNASQVAVKSDDSALICFLRRSIDGNQTILVAANVGNATTHFNPSAVTDAGVARDLTSCEELSAANSWALEPGRCVWISD